MQLLLGGPFRWTFLDAGDSPWVVFLDWWTDSLGSVGMLWCIPIRFHPGLLIVEEAAGRAGEAEVDAMRVHLVRLRPGGRMELLPGDRVELRRENLWRLSTSRISVVIFNDDRLVELMDRLVERLHFMRKLELDFYGDKFHQWMSMNLKV